VTQQVQALVYQLNRELQDAYIDANLEYVSLILEGGQGDFGGREFDVLGLEGARQLLRELPRGPRLDRIREFVDTAELALEQTDEALVATAAPIELVQAPERGRTWALSAQVQAYALGLTVTFLALMLAAGALAAERDENVVGRLARGLAGLGQLVWAKAALAAVVALALGLAIALAFGLAIELGNVEGGEPWERLPLLAGGLALAGACVGALGALVGGLAREARAASLVSLLVVLPIVFLGLVPREVVPAAGWLSDGLPFAHSVRFFASALYDADPWRTLAVETAWLAGLALLFGLAARAAGRRLLA
jgi:ABC-2 type transport system permease protein